MRLIVNQNPIFFLSQVKFMLHLRNEDKQFYHQSKAIDSRIFLFFGKSLVKRLMPTPIYGHMDVGGHNI